jgi:hypothetical protein
MVVVMVVVPVLSLMLAIHVTQVVPFLLLSLMKALSQVLVQVVMPTSIGCPLSNLTPWVAVMGSPLLESLNQ